MADWNKPTTTSGYLDFVAEMNAKFVDAALMQFTASVNQPDGTFRYNRSTNIFQEFGSGTWNDKAIGVGGGGTGATNPAQARTNLGIGTMGTQNSNAVNITGGSITGVAYNANDITSGVLALARGGTGSALAGTQFGDVLLWNGGQIVLAPGVNIRSFDGSYITQGTIPLARLGPVATGPGPNGFQGQNIYYADSGPETPIGFVSNYPGMSFLSNTAIAGKHRMRLFHFQDTMRWQRLDDGYTVSADLLTMSWDGVVTCYGGGITNLNASNITDGQVAAARLGAGVANSSTFLRGDLTWQVVTSGTPGETIPSGMIALFSTNCPAGWTRVAALDGRFPMGSTGYGAAGGATQHSHSFGLNTSDAGGHDHGFSGSGSGSAGGDFGGSTGGASVGVQTADAGGSFQTVGAHTHGFNVRVDLTTNVNISGRTDGVGNHNHQVNGNTSAADSYPPYVTVVYCQKN
jgi:hypothetical protein